MSNSTEKPSLCRRKTMVAENQLIRLESGFLSLLKLSKKKKKKKKVMPNINREYRAHNSD